MAHFGCESVRLPNKPTPETRCLNNKLTVKNKIEEMNAFERVVDGEDGCHPCIPEIPKIRERLDHIRGDEEGQSK